MPVVIAMAHTTVQPICAARPKCGRKTVSDVAGVIVREIYISNPTTSAAGAEVVEKNILEDLKIINVAEMIPIIIHTTVTSNFVTKMVEELELE